MLLIYSCCIHIAKMSQLAKNNNIYLYVLFFTYKLYTYMEYFLSCAPFFISASQLLIATVNSHHSYGSLLAHHYEND